MKFNLRVSVLLLTSKFTRGTLPSLKETTEKRVNELISITNIPQNNDLSYYPEAPSCWMKAYDRVPSHANAHDDTSGNWIFSDKTSEMLFTIDLIRCLGIDQRVFKYDSEDAEAQNSNSICRGNLFKETSGDFGTLSFFPTCFQDVIGELIYDEVFMQADSLFTAIHKQVGYAKRMKALASALLSIESDTLVESNSTITKAYSTSDENCNRTIDCAFGKEDEITIFLPNATELDVLIQSVFDFNEIDNERSRLSLRSWMDFQIHSILLSNNLLDSIFSSVLTYLSWIGNALHIPAKFVLTIIITTSKPTSPFRFKFILAIFLRIAFEGYLLSSSVPREIQNELVDVADKLVEFCLGLVFIFLAFSRSKYNSSKNHMEKTCVELETEADYMSSYSDVSKTDMITNNRPYIQHCSESHRVPTDHRQQYQSNQKRISTTVSKSQSLICRVDSPNDILYHIDCKRNINEDDLKPNRYITECIDCCRSVKDRKGIELKSNPIVILQEEALDELNDENRFKSEKGNNLPLHRKRKRTDKSFTQSNKQDNKLTVITPPARKLMRRSYST